MRVLVNVNERSNTVKSLSLFCSFKCLVYAIQKLIRTSSVTGSFSLLIETSFVLKTSSGTRLSPILLFSAI